MFDTFYFSLTWFLVHVRPVKCRYKCVPYLEKCEIYWKLDILYIGLLDVQSQNTGFRNASTQIVYASNTLQDMKTSSRKERDVSTMYCFSFAMSYHYIIQYSDIIWASWRLKSRQVDCFRDFHHKYPVIRKVHQCYNIIIVLIFAKSLEMSKQTIYSILNHIVHKHWCQMYQVIMEDLFKYRHNPTSHQTETRQYDTRITFYVDLLPFMQRFV